MQPTYKPVLIEVGAFAPDFELDAIITTNATLKQHQPSLVRLNTHYRNKQAVLLYFMREFTWAVCRSHVRQLAQLYPQIQKEFATEILIIGGGSIKEATNLVKTYDLLFPVATDPEHKVYISYNLNRIASFYQRSGVFVLDKQGKVRYAQRAILPSGGLDVPEVMKALYSL